mgnify:CR=1 FL=1
MKELVKNGDKHEIVEDGKVLFSTESGPEMLAHVEKAKYPVFYIRNTEPWTKPVKDPES